MTVELRLLSAGTPSVRLPVSPVRLFSTTAGQESRSRWVARLLILVDVAVLGLIALVLMDAGRSWWRATTPEQPERRPRVATVAMPWTMALIAGVLAFRLGGWPAGIVAFLIGLYLKEHFFYPGRFLLRETAVVFTVACADAPCWRSPAPGLCSS